MHSFLSLGGLTVIAFGVSLVLKIGHGYTFSSRWCPNAVAYVPHAVVDVAVTMYLPNTVKRSWLSTLTGD